MKAVQVFYNDRLAGVLSRLGGFYRFAYEVRAGF